MNNRDKDFEALSAELFKRYLELNPQAGFSIGKHEYDGIIPDVTDRAVEDYIAECERFVARLEEFKKEELLPVNRYDLELAKWALKSEIFKIREIASHRFNPMAYAFMFGDLHNYISREFATFDDRLRSVNSILRRVPEVLKQAEGVLDKKLPSVLCKYAIAFSKGYEDFFRGELLNVIRDRAESGALVEEYIQLSGKAVEAFDEYARLLESASDDECKSYILGSEKFLKMLAVTEEIDLSLEELKQMGLDELHRLQSELNGVLSESEIEGGIEKLEHDHPTVDSLVKDTTDTLDGLISFLREKNLVNLPDRLNCMVTEMPRYMNFGFAAMDTAGPFEKSDESYYYVNLPDAGWDEEKKEEWMTQFNYPILKLISIHEAYPGHYTHFLNANANSTLLSKLFMSYSYIEGWAHYTEEMMVEQGYGKEDPKTEIGMLLEALIRCCRYLVAIGVHCEGMSIEEAKDFFVKNAMMQEVTALQEAERAAFDPGYLNYTLGKIMLKNFKMKFFSRFGTEKSLREFHDSVVSLGAPTYRIAEEYVLS